VEPYLQPWWNFVVGCLPLWLAPNLITIIGLFLNILTSLLLVYYNPDGKQDFPRWVALLCALGLFIYQTLDAIDGKQARRTGSASPLGELFDHGCDSLSTVFVTLAACLTVGLGSHPWCMLFQCFTGFILFYLAHWQTYISGTLKFGKFNATEAQWCIIGLHMLTYLFGVKIWEQQLPLLGLEYKMFGFLLVLLAQSYAIITEYVVPIMKGDLGKNGLTVAGTSVLSPGIPIYLAVVSAYIIAFISNEQIFEQHPALYIITFGLIISKLTNQLVVAHMTKGEMDSLFDTSVLDVPVWLILGRLCNRLIPEYYVLWVCLVLAALALYRYCRRVCSEICRALNIEVFRIKPPVSVPARQK